MCKFHGCNNHDGMKNIKFTHVPKPALEKSKPKPSDRIEKFERYYSKHEQHKQFIRRMGLSEKDFDYHNTRICSAHKRVMLEKSMDVSCLVKGEMKKQKIKFTYEVPESCDVKSTLF